VADRQRQKWDAGRFFKTLAYFRVIPFSGFFECIANLFGRSSKSSAIAPTQPGIVLVVGATGGVGKRVVRKLQERGYPVRALVRNLDRGRQILGDRVEMVEGDLLLPETLSDRLMHDVSTVICCSGTKVQPKEGDTPNREKYYQGIKFYMPEVVDVPELVEYKGIRHLVDATRRQLNQWGNSSSKMLFDFRKVTQDLKETLGVLDDIVMGGVSESNVRIVENTALFTGNVSISNSGGFVSIRTRNFDPPLDLSAYQGIDLRVKGDGKRYKFILRNESQWDSRSYCYSFDTVSNIWFTVRIPFADLIPVFRAKTVNNAPPFDPKTIYSIQLMLSKFEYDGELNPKFEPGFFQLQVESISAYGAQEKPQFVHVSSAGVTRPGRPDLNLEEEPPAVRMNDQLGGILTWKLRGEDVIRASGIPYTIVRPCALTEEPGGKDLIFDRGDNIKGKVSREDIAELCVQALENPQAVDLTFEVKEGMEKRPEKYDLSQLERDRIAII